MYGASQIFISDDKMAGLQEEEARKEEESVRTKLALSQVPPLVFLKFRLENDFFSKIALVKSQPGNFPTPEYVFASFA